MPLLFWIDVGFSCFAMALSSALMLIAAASGLNQPLNRSFAVFTFIQTAWAGFSIALRLALWDGSGNPLFLSECVAMTLILMGLSVLIFSAQFVGRSRPWLTWTTVLSCLVLVPVAHMLFSHQTIINPRLHSNGTTLVDVLPHGFLVASFPAIFLLWSFLLFWRDRHRTGETYMASSVLILLVGFMLGGLAEIHVPVESITHTASICLLGYGVLTRQLFNPLRETTEILRRQILERERAEAALTDSLREKEVLLKEIHHRVKNNLQVISSLLSLQSQSIRNKRLLALFTESRNRIQSMALIHEQLYRTTDFSSIHFRDYVNSLVGNLCRAYDAGSRRIDVATDIRVQRLDMDKAVPLGLVLNEILSNALKYAFPPGFEKSCRIAVQMRESRNGRIVLIIKDNGIGLPADFSAGTSKSLGLHLVRLLVEDQLQGTLRFDTRSGTAYRISFPIEGAA
jgi:two-component sensor histidine kinase